MYKLFKLSGIGVVSVLFSVPSIISHELVFGIFGLLLSNELILS